MSLDHVAKKHQAREKLRNRGISCGDCPHFETLDRENTHVFCGVNAGCGDRKISAYVGISEASKCPGPELRALFLNAPAFYAARRQESS